MAIQQCRLVLLACAVGLVFVTTADHRSDALIELGTSASFTGVVSSRNFVGEGKALKGIDQALEAKDPLVKVGPEDDYDDGNAGGAKKTSNAEALELSDLERKLDSIPGRPQQQHVANGEHPAKAEAMDLAALEAKLDGSSPTKPAHTKSQTETHQTETHKQNEDSKSDPTRDESKHDHPSKKAHHKSSQISCADSDEDTCNPKHCLCKNPRKLKHTKMTQIVRKQRSDKRSAAAILRKLKLASQRMSKISTGVKHAPISSDVIKVKTVKTTTNSQKREATSTAEILEKLKQASNRFKAAALE
jgi:hypothetical protein